MKLTTFEMNGKKYHLLLNGTALFNFYDRFGSDADLIGALTEDDEKKAFISSIWMLSEFSVQGELYRRSQGMDKGVYIRAEQAALEVTPADIPRLKMALAATIKAGFRRDHQADEDYDPWLAEINQKKTNILHGRNTSGCLSKSLASLLRKA